MPPLSPLSAYSAPLFRALPASLRAPLYARTPRQLRAATLFSPRYFLSAILR